MVTKTNKAPTVATLKKVAAPAAGLAPTGAGTAPVFLCNAATWPVKSQGGNTIRAYAYQIALQLSGLQKTGFTVQQFKQALAAGVVGKNKPVQGYAQPCGGWAAHNMHTYSTNTARSWCLPPAAAVAALTKLKATQLKLAGAS